MDKEKVIKGLEMCRKKRITGVACLECPYAEAEGGTDDWCIRGLYRDAIALLKEQEKLEERLQHAIEVGEEYRKEWEIKNSISDAAHETAKQSQRQIILCKDCKYGVKCLPDSSNYSCTKAFGEKTPHSYDWYCADGKRRTDDA